jgi:hypothetical protein
MRSWRLLPALVLALVFVQPALADGRDRPKLTKTVGTAHVLVHYTSDALSPDAVTSAQATTAARTLNAIWLQETGWGFPPPASDHGLGGDDRLDAYIAVAPQHRSFVDWDDANWPISGFITFDPSDVKDTRSAQRYYGTLAHEFFHTIQIQWAVPEAQLAPYFMEATAEWAGHRASSAYRGAGPLFAYAPEAPLDCPGTVCGTAGDGARGYGQWPFFEYLSERYGATIIRRIFERDAAIGWLSTPGGPVWQGQSHALEAIDSVLADHHTSLSRVWNQYATFNLNPNRYRLTALRNLRIWSKPTHLMLVPNQSKSYAPLTVSVDHLATTYVSLLTVDCDETAAAVAGTLHVRVTLPAGSAAVPALRTTFGLDKPVIRALRITRNVASIDVPGWRDCMTARLSLPNPSLTQDGASYVVTVSVTRGRDRRPPKVVALPAVGHTGTGISLRYQAYDDSGYTAELIRVYSGTRVLMSHQTPMGHLVTPFPSVAWLAPNTTGTFRFCVRAKDPSGNVSAWSCAPIRVLP